MNFDNQQCTLRCGDVGSHHRTQRTSRQLGASCVYCRVRLPSQEGCKQYPRVNMTEDSSVDLLSIVPLIMAAVVQSILQAGVTAGPGIVLGRSGVLTAPMIKANISLHEHKEPRGLGHRYEVLVPSVPAYCER